jgi:hypothetical protein
VDQTLHPSRSPRAPRARLAVVGPPASELSPVGGPSGLPAVLADLRRRAPGMWTSVRRHPGVQAVAARAAGWSDGVRERGALSSVSGPSARRPRSGAETVDAPLAEVVALQPGRRPRSGRGVRPFGAPEAVVIDLERYRTERWFGEPGLA